MLTTAVAVLAAIALLLPGFIVVEVAIARGARSSRSDLELALRALAYALIVHLAFGWWTASLVERVGPVAEWDEHVGALSLYTGVVLVVVPILLGLFSATCSPASKAAMAHRRCGRRRSVPGRRAMPMTSCFNESAQTVRG